MTDIIIDFDNTIANTSETVLRHMPGLSTGLVDGKVIGQLPIEEYRENLEWDFRPYWQGDKKHVLDWMASEEFWSKLEVMPNFMNQLGPYNFDCRFYVCSCRGKNNYTQLVDWCDKKGISKYLSDIILLTASSFDKSILAAPNRVIIDDQPRCLVGNWGTRVLFGKWKYQVDALKQMQHIPECSWAINEWNDCHVARYIPTY